MIENLISMIFKIRFTLFNKKGDIDSRSIISCKEEQNGKNSRN